MKRIIEKNIEEFNKDISKHGSYKYTSHNHYSAAIATSRQTSELIKILKNEYKKDLTILDAGCGDGTFTYEVYKQMQPKKIVGFDIATSAISLASKNNREKRIFFEYCNIYDIDKKYTKQKFDIVIVRGVLHHLYDHKKAIKALSKVADKIILLEPNGYNPILKVIEKISFYHRKHEEKSFWPPTLNKLFLEQGFGVETQVFCGIVPYFFPTSLAKILHFIEPVMEKFSISKYYCGTNIIYYKKIK